MLIPFSLEHQPLTLSKEERSESQQNTNKSSSSSSSYRSFLNNCLPISLPPSPLADTCNKRPTPQSICGSAFIRVRCWPGSWASGSGSSTCIRGTWSWPTRWNQAEWPGKYSHALMAPENWLCDNDVRFRCLRQSGSHFRENVRLPERRVRSGAGLRGAAGGVAAHRRPENLFHHESA